MHSKAKREERKRARCAALHKAAIHFMALTAMSLVKGGALCDFPLFRIGIAMHTSEQRGMQALLEYSGPEALSGHGE